MGVGIASSIGFVALVAFMVGPISQFLRITGIFLVPNPTVLLEGQGPIHIEDTVQCEDLHHYRPANLLFTACEDDKNGRFSWFPPLGNLMPITTRGSIHIIDPETLKSTRLAFENFDGPFITHGIDVIEDPEQANAVYIYAVNHLPNPASSEASKSENIPKARSQIELFHHILKSDSVRHVRSIYHPLIKTPNDIFAASPVSFYVTNDHFYREGTMRHIEDFWPAAGWSDIIHVQIDNLASKDAPIEASVALTGLRNNNGLGHGRTKKEMAIVSPIGGKLYIASLHESDPSISVGTTVSFDTLIDNPTYYTDPYRTEADDASGFVIAGVSQAFKVPANSIDPNATDPSQVWYTRLNPGSGVWEKRLLFEDDGSRIRSASAAVLIPIDPKGGKKLAWLFITGFLSESILVVQVEL